MSLSVQLSNKASFSKDAVVFFVTVATCTVLLTVACTAGKSATLAATEPLPELILPQRPVPLALLPEPTAIPSRKGASGGGLALAVSDGAPVPGDVENAAMILPAANDALSEESVPFQGIIVQVAGRYEVDPHLVRAIIFAESGFNPRAKSKKGARGLMQLMPSTAKALGVRNIYDPRENIDGGVRYFRLLLDRFDGDVQLALAAYNAGSRHVRNYEGVPPFKATRRYIKKVLKFQEKFKLQNKAGFRSLA